MMMDRNTIATDAEFDGLGLHSGDPVRMVVHSGESGIRFHYAGEWVEAKPGNVTDTKRCTRLGPVSTIEHLMSAFAGLEITDADVELSAPELPGMDGSALPFVKGLMAVGRAKITEIEAPSLFKRVFVQEDDVKIAVAKGSGHWRAVYATGDRWPGVQAFETEQVLIDYRDQIAPARTFALAEEVPMIIQLGMGRGLDEHSALVLGIEGYKNPPRFPDEPARHKLLDLIGDLYLAGIPIQYLSVGAERSGHRANVKTAQMLYESIGGAR
jgi:UDP-3-O-acyl-N-acetylglucosamine deacetylase